MRTPSPLLLLCVSVAAAAAAVADDDERLVVTTENGRVRGTYNVDILGKITAPFRDTSRFSVVYQSIPFAAAPVGKLRFRSPTPYTDNWNGIRDVSSYPPPCPQNFFTTKTQSEDCLFLNVFTPSEKRMREAGRPLPVMVWIFGGAFFLGDSYMTGVYNPRTMTDNADVIVVTFNYRLGVFGFFDINDNHSNLAIEDQRMALQWLKRNVANFGGDPDKILIYGLSAGATSAAIHMTSPMSDKGLFSRVIQQSSPLGGRMRLREDVMHESRTLASTLGCVRDDRVSLACMQEKSVLDILRASREYMNDPTKRPETNKGDRSRSLSSSNDRSLGNGDSGSNTTLQGEPDASLGVSGIFDHADDNNVAHELGDQYKWWPYIDNKNIVDQPLNMIRDGRYPRDISLMIGIQQDEAAYWMRTYDTPIKGSKAEKLALNQTAHTLHMRTTFGKDFDRVVQLYPIRGQIKENKDEMIKLGTDYVFNCPTEQVAMDMKRYSTRNVYVYTWTLPVFPPLGICAKRACHSNDLPFMFRTLWPLTGSRKELQKQVMAYWTNFAASGDPNRRLDGKIASGVDDAVLAPWPAYDPATKERLELGERLRTTGPLRPDHCKLWNEELGYNFDDVSDRAMELDMKMAPQQFKLP